MKSGVNSFAMLANAFSFLLSVTNASTIYTPNRYDERPTPRTPNKPHLENMHLYLFLYLPFQTHLRSHIPWEAFLGSLPYPKRKFLFTLSLQHAMLHPHFCLVACALSPTWDHELTSQARTVCPCQPPGFITDQRILTTPSKGLLNHTDMSPVHRLSGLGLEPFESPDLGFSVSKSASESPSTLQITSQRDKLPC